MNYKYPNESGIYAIIHRESGKRYVGSAVNINLRFRMHKSALTNGRHCNRHLQSAWNKYGKDAFSFFVLELCEKKLLLIYEQSYIDEKADYNLCLVAGNQLGVKRSEATKQLQSKVQKERLKDNPEAVLKMLSGLLTPESMRKSAAAVRTPKERTRRSAVFDDPKYKARQMARLNSPEAQAKSRATQDTPERRLAKSMTAKNTMSKPENIVKSHNPEANAKRSLSARASWDNKRLKKEASERTKKRWADPVSREKMLLSFKEGHKRKKERLLCQVL